MRRIAQVGVRVWGRRVGPRFVHAIAPRVSRHLLSQLGEESFHATEHLRRVRRVHSPREYDAVRCLRDLQLMEVRPVGIVRWVDWHPLRVLERRLISGRHSESPRQYRQNQSNRLNPLPSCPYTIGKRGGSGKPLKTVRIALPIRPPPERGQELVQARQLDDLGQTVAASSDPVRPDECGPEEADHGAARESPAAGPRGISSRCRLPGGRRRAARSGEAGGGCPTGRPGRS